VTTTLAKSGRERGGGGSVGGNSTKIRIPSGMRQGFGGEKEKENRHVSFTERDGMRNKRVNQVRGEFGPKRNCPCPFKRMRNS